MPFSGVGVGEMLIIGMIILIVFGPQRLPEISRQFGKALREFKRGMNEIQRELQVAERESRTRTTESASRASPPKPPAGRPDTSAEEPRLAGPRRDEGGGAGSDAPVGSRPVGSGSRIPTFGRSGEAEEPLPARGEGAEAPPRRDRGGEDEPEGGADEEPPDREETQEPARPDPAQSDFFS